MDVVSTNRRHTRANIATAAMSAMILSDRVINNLQEPRPSHIAQLSVQIADAMMKELGL